MRDVSYPRTPSITVAWRLAETKVRSARLDSSAAFSLVDLREVGRLAREQPVQLFRITYELAVGFSHLNLTSTSLASRIRLDSLIRLSEISLLYRLLKDRKSPVQGVQRPYRLVGRRWRDLRADW